MCYHLEVKGTVECLEGWIKSLTTCRPLLGYLVLFGFRIQRALFLFLFFYLTILLLDWFPFCGLF